MATVHTRRYLTKDAWCTVLYLFALVLLICNESLVNAAEAYLPAPASGYALGMLYALGAACLSLVMHLERPRGANLFIIMAALIICAGMGIKYGFGF